jgi:hypothetical protein
MGQQPDGHAEGGRRNVGTCQAFDLSARRKSCRRHPPKSVAAAELRSPGSARPRDGRRRRQVSWLVDRRPVRAFPALADQWHDAARAPHSQLRVQPRIWPDGPHRVPFSPLSEHRLTPLVSRSRDGGKGASRTLRRLARRCGAVVTVETVHANSVAEDHAVPATPTANRRGSCRNGCEARTASL